MRQLEELDAGELYDTVGLAPFGEAAHRIQVRFARVVVIDLSGETFEHAPRGLGRRHTSPGRKHGGRQEGGRGGDEVAGRQVSHSSSRVRRSRTVMNKRNICLCLPWSLVIGDEAILRSFHRGYRSDLPEATAQMAT
jgi:hypothetical protein